MIPRSPPHSGKPSKLRNGRSVVKPIKPTASGFRDRWPIHLGRGDHADSKIGARANSLFYVRVPASMAVPETVEVPNADRPLKTPESLCDAVRDRGTERGRRAVKRRAKRPMSHTRSKELGAAESTTKGGRRRNGGRQKARAARILAATRPENLAMLGEIERNFYWPVGVNIPLGKKTGASDAPHPQWHCRMARGKSTILPVVVRGPAGQSHLGTAPRGLSSASPYKHRACRYGSPCGHAPPGYSR